MLRKVYMKTTSILIAMAMLIVSCTVHITPAQATASNTITVDGHVFTVIRNDFDTISIEYRNGNRSYVFALCREAAEISATKHCSNSTLRGASVDTFRIMLNPYILYYYGGEVRDIVLLDVGNNITFHQNHAHAMSSVVVPIGWLLLRAAIQALLAIGSAVLLAGVTWIAVDQLLNQANRDRTFRYFAGLLHNGRVFAGNGLTHQQARVIISKQDRMRGVVATTQNYARGLAGNNPIGPEGFHNPPFSLRHFHTGGFIRGTAHIWFLA